MIRGVYIFLTSGLPIFHTTLGHETESINQILFGGISSAINMLIKEIAHSELQSINVEDGILKYSVQNDLIFVVHSKGQKGGEIASFLIKQIIPIFIADYGTIISPSVQNVIDSSLFQPFERKVREIHKIITELFTSHRNLVEFIPQNIPLVLIQELLEEGDNLIEGFPNDTIRLIRRLNDKYETDIKNEIMFSLGVYFGIEISKNKYPHKVNISQDDVLKLLNEISVAKFEKNQRVFVLSLCPICRGKTSTKPMCNFFTGFIEGCFDNPNLVVNETTCKARGDKYCSYNLKYSRD